MKKVKIRRMWTSVAELQEMLNVNNSYVYRLMKSNPQLKYYRFIGRQIYFLTEEIEEMVNKNPVLLTKRIEATENPNDKLKLIYNKYTIGQYKQPAPNYIINECLVNLLNHEDTDELPDKEYLSIDELADYLNISKIKIYKLKNHPQIKFYTIKGKKYVKNEEIDNFIKSNVQSTT
jgi:excisionase family DNA binding protein